MRNESTPSVHSTDAVVPTASPLGVTASWRTRTVSLAVMAAGIAVLAVAAWLDANPRGLGTHTQLGWAPCGFESRTGLPCATCGMTTATTLAANGQLLSSLRVQPGGFLFALSAGLTVIIGGWSAWTGRSLKPIALALVKPKALISIGVVILLAWSYRVADALLGNPWTTLT
ncbi:MAG: DUF2752 domain-containing protein [Planctomycetota bacterium]